MCKILLPPLLGGVVRVFPVDNALLDDNCTAKVDVLRPDAKLASHRVDLAVLNGMHAVHAQELCV